ncbi:MAG: hypothetical protein M3Q58_14920 [Bacteroidota bacterium]|nr:hypothetical protein [Bacteroidota bacterium]
MTIRTNKQMEEYLIKTGTGILNKTIALPFELEQILKSEFLINNDCTILKGIHSIKEIPDVKTDIEKCELEYKENNIHPIDFIEHPGSELEYLTLAVECGKKLSNRLITEFKNKKFRIIISFNETKKEMEKIVQFGGSSVSFYNLRNGCDNKMRIKNLEEIKLEAILEIEI